MESFLSHTAQLAPAGPPTRANGPSPRDNLLTCVPFPAPGGPNKIAFTPSTLSSGLAAGCACGTGGIVAGGIYNSFSLRILVQDGR